MLLQVLSKTIAGETDENGEEEVLFDQSRFFIRLFNFEPVLPLKHLKASQYGKWTSLLCVLFRES